MWYYIVACWVEGKKMFAVYPEMNVSGGKTPDVDRLQGYFVMPLHAEHFIQRVLSGKVYV